METNISKSHYYKNLCKQKISPLYKVHYLTKQDAVFYYELHLEIQCQMSLLLSVEKKKWTLTLMKLQMDKSVHTNPSGHKENLKSKQELIIRCSKIN